MARALRTTSLLAALLCSMVLLGSCGAEHPGDRPLAAAIRRQLAHRVPGPHRATVDDDDIQPLVRRFYAGRNDRPAWTHLEGPTQDARDLLEALDRAPSHGLDPAEYGTAELHHDVEAAAKPLALTSSTRPTELAALDVRLTRAFLKYGTHRSSGQVNPLQLPADWHIRPRHQDVGAALAQELANHRIEAALDGLDPTDPQYAKLRDALARLRELQARGGAPPPGLGLPLGAAIRRIELNLERLRWMPDSLVRGRYVEVNIPGFELAVVENGRRVMTMRVVVGRQFSPTPMFSDRISYLVFNPAWRIPPHVAATEILPEVQRNPRYLEENDMHVMENEGRDAREVDPRDVHWQDLDSTSFHYAVRQDPGPKNPLGHVKFMCPNQYDVYLHDTPAGHLFDARARGFSHGCIRVEQPRALADYLLRDKPGWDSTRVGAAFDSSRDQSVTLAEPVPVHILYWTAFVDDAGRLQFRDDIYGLDGLLDRVLRTRPPSI